MTSQIGIVLLIGLIAGVMSGMFGIGGGVIIVPALIIFAGFPQTLANGTSLAALLLPVAIFAVLAYYRAKLIDIKASVMIALGLFTGVFGGAKIALNLPANTLMQLYGLFLLYASWRFIEPAELWQLILKKEKTDSSNTAPKSIKKPNSNVFLIIPLGIIAGLFSGLFGIGGGIIIVPVLSTFFHYNHKIAIGTSLGALLLPVGLPGVICYGLAGQFDVLSAAPVALGLLIGAIFGANITIKLPSMIIRKLYGLFLFFIALNSIFQGWI
ncbi:MAG: sulfite exporter TauE/SafE family protein [Candidatus Marinimicrobia bacterium]|nr:sulfite exporter TauE/SafE family protein [Candidatus Neomarinimicrobiota bacterium]